MTHRQLFEWSAFALTALLCCLLLALRPVPSVGNANDTGRYVQAAQQFCEGKSVDIAENKESSYTIFYVATYPACLAQSDGLFMFEVAAFVPLIFLLFTPWHRDTYLWACSLLFSVYGLELMTNAMRQSLATLLFFGGVALLQKHPRKASMLAVLAVVAHTSILAYVPFFLWVRGARLSRKGRFIGVFFALCFIVIGGMVYGSAIAGFLAGLSELRDFYMTIYEEHLNTSFILFMVVPLYFVYGLRYLFEGQHISSAERKAVIYSTSLILVGLIVSPAIAYRFAILAIPLQIFLVTISERHSFKVGGMAMIGMMVHLAIMLSISKNYSVLLYG